MQSSSSAISLQLEDFRVLETIGKGSYGECMLVRLRTASLNHLSALKSSIDAVATRATETSINNDSSAEPDKFVIKKIQTRGLSPRERKDTMTEVRVLSSLHHPNIIHYAANFLDKGSRALCIVMEYAAGGDLSHCLRRRRSSGRGLFAEQKVISWFVQICLGVKHCHDRKVLHRDLKPQNIFLTRQGTIKIGDFGIAKVLSNTTDLAKTAIGTPYYLSPEICQEKSYNHKSDVWSLGCILYEMATLRHAFDGRNMKLLVLKIVRGTHGQLPKQFTPEARRLVNDMLRRNPKSRPSVNDMLSRRILRVHINTFLSEGQQREEFSHTILHGQHLHSNARPRSNVGAKVSRDGQRQARGLGKKKHPDARISGAAQNNITKANMDRQNRILLMRQAKQKMKAQKRQREQDRKAKQVQQENQRRQLRVLLQKAKAKRKATKCGQVGSPCLNIQSRARKREDRKKSQDQSWEIRYMNIGGVDVIHKKTKDSSRGDVKREKPPNKDNQTEAKSPVDTNMDSKGQKVGQQAPSKLERFNQQWALRREEIYKLAGIKAKATDKEVDAASRREHLSKVESDAKDDAKSHASNNRKMQHEKGLAELRAMYLAERRKREMLKGDGMQGKARRDDTGESNALNTPSAASSPSESSSLSPSRSPPPPAPSSGGNCKRPMVPPSFSPKKYLDLVALRKRAENHISETRKGKRNEDNVVNQDIPVKLNAGYGNVGRISTKIHNNAKAQLHQRVPLVDQKMKGKSYGQKIRQKQKKYNKKSLKYQCEDQGNSYNTEKRIEQKRRAWDAARKRMRDDILRRCKNKKSTTPGSQVSIMVPSKFAGALRESHENEGVCGKDNEVVFLNLKDHARLDDIDPSDSLTHSPLDIDISFEDESYGQSGSDCEDEDKMPFDLPSWPRRFGTQDDTLKVSSPLYEK